MPSPQYTSACITYFGSFDTTNFPEFVSFCSGQKERCPTSGRLHWQLYAEFKRRVTRPTIQRWLPGAHVERRQGSQQQAIDYTQKDESYVSDRFTFGTPADLNPGHRTDLDNAIAAVRAGGLRRAAEDTPREFVKFHRGLERLSQVLTDHPRDTAFVPRDWQTDLINLIMEDPNDRTIIWVHDSVGGKGKSRLARHLLCEYNGVLLSGRIVDMAYTYNKERVAIFDIARSQEENLKHLYSFAEMLKNGVFHSTKYESVVKMFTPPHVIFFSNTFPEDSAWSRDRLKLIDLDEA